MLDVDVAVDLHVNKKAVSRHFADFVVRAQNVVLVGNEAAHVYIVHAIGCDLGSETAGQFACRVKSNEGFAENLSPKAKLLGCLVVLSVPLWHGYPRIC